MSEHIMPGRFAADKQAAEARIAVADRQAKENLAARLRARLQEPEGFTISLRTVLNTHYSDVAIANLHGECLEIETIDPGRLNPSPDRVLINLHYVVELIIHEG